MRGAVVLAGGSGRRFKRAGGVGEKALFKVGGRPMLKRVVEAVSEVVDEVVVAVDSEERARRLSGEVDGRVVMDRRGVSGPLAGMEAGLRGLSSTACLVVPCDQPFLKPSVLDRLLRGVEEGWEGVMPLWPHGLHEPLMAAYLREPALALCSALLAYGRSRPDDLVRAGLNTLFLSVAELKPLDPPLLSFINVNRPSDVEAGPKLEVDGGSSVELKWGFNALEAAKAAFSSLRSLDPAPLSSFSSSFWQGLAYCLVAERRGEEAWRLAARSFKREAEAYASKGLKLLEVRALVDVARCLRNVDLEGSKMALEDAVAIYRQLKVEDKEVG
jgi:molybdopterin-guanine dinucleotide biosynthesis protein A